MSSAGPRYRSAALTDQGTVRGNNEDRVYTDDGRGIYLVVDGMGGYEAGEHAAELAVATIKARLERQTGAVEQRVREAIALANNAIFEAARQNPAWHGMACVLTLAVVENGHATVGHVGDSRLYTVRRGHLDKVTHDHSPVGEREDNGELSEAAAMKHPRRNEVFRDVGSEEHTPEDEDFIEIQRIPFAADAALLLCSDGLSDALSSKQILDIVEHNAGDGQVALRALVSAATKVGKDNVSAVLVEGEAFATSLQQNSSPRRVRGFASKAAYFVVGGLLGAGLVYWMTQFMGFPNRAASAQQLTVTAPGSISAALEKAHSGDTISVAPGTYREAVRLKAGVALLARDSRTTIVQGPVTADDIDKAAFEGFKVDGPNGIRITNSDVMLTRDEILGGHGAGVEFSGNSRGAIVACKIHDNEGSGIVLNGAASPAIEHNLIAQNGTKPEALQPGLWIRSPASIDATGNIFEGNGAEAIWLPAEDKALVQSNFFPGAPESDKKPKFRVIGSGENQP